MGLSNYQLVLLDNLIYLNQVTKVSQGETTIGEVVNNLLYKDGDESAGIVPEQSFRTVSTIINRETRKRQTA